MFYHLQSDAFHAMTSLIAILYSGIEYAERRSLNPLPNHRQLKFLTNNSFNNQKPLVQLNIPPPPSKRNNSHGFAHWEDLSDGVAVMEGTLILNIYKPQTEPQVFVREYMYILNIITGSTQFLSLINL